MKFEKDQKNGRKIENYRNYNPSDFKLFDSSNLYQATTLIYQSNSSQGFEICMKIKKTRKNKTNSVAKASVYPQIRSP